MPAVVLPKIKEPWQNFRFLLPLFCALLKLSREKVHQVGYQYHKGTSSSKKRLHRDSKQQTSKWLKISEDVWLSPHHCLQKNWFSWNFCCSIVIWRSICRSLYTDEKYLQCSFFLLNFNLIFNVFFQLRYMSAFLGRAYPGRVVTKPGLWIGLYGLD